MPDNPVILKCLKGRWTLTVFGYFNALLVIRLGRLFYRRLWFCIRDLVVRKYKTQG